MNIEAKIHQTREAAWARLRRRHRVTAGLALIVTALYMLGLVALWLLGMLFLLKQVL